MKQGMKTVGLLAALACASGVAVQAQVDEKLKADIISTGYVHSPLPLDESKSFDKTFAIKKVLKSEMLCDMEDASVWEHKGVGSISITDERCKSGKHSLRLEAPTHPEKMLGWGLGRGTCLASYNVGGVNWEGYNRLKFYIYPSCGNARSIYLNLYLENDGEIKVPDIYGREGYHEINLKNNQWNECYLEMTGLGEFETIDFSDFQTAGQYFIQVGDVATLPFYIDKNVWEDSAWRMVNFLFCERCGYPVPGKHGACHNDLHANWQGHIIPINGGWHDAADMSQQTLQTGEIAYSLFQTAARAKKSGNVNLYNRLMEEALWGMDYILKTRLGDGYRAQTWGTNLWTDHKIGTDDDSGRREMFVHNGALENFLLSGIEAYASMMIENDPGLKGHLKEIAQEDFGYAMERFNKLGFAELVKEGGGHAGMASESQYHANISWAASMLYKLTGDQQYADEAVKAIQYVLQCQRTEPLKDKNKTCGFFYRDLAKKSIVHYTHQSRDYAYMEALAALCETQPNHADYDKWIASMQLYGNYLKNIMQYVQPYGMVPSGIYHKNEVKDSVNFYAVQVGIRSGAEKDFKEQLENGIKLDKEHYLRIFPVWFSFKGNTAVNLSTGKAAAICARILKDKELKNIAEQQLFWVVGKNPFGQSLIYGEGSKYPQLYTALPGETVGEIPVGMQSYFNEDAPYWPQFNTATYKEVWGSSAARWLMLISEF